MPVEAPVPARDFLIGVAVSAASRHYALVSADDYVFPARWLDVRGRSVEDEESRGRLEKELVREVAPTHPLHHVAASAVAACTHCDDVLFALADGRYAVVHLSYPRSAPDRPPWPGTDLLPSWEAAVAYVSEHEDR